MVFICSFGRRSTGVLVVVDEESCRRNSKKRRPEGINKKVANLTYLLWTKPLRQMPSKGRGCVGAWPTRNIASRNTHLLIFFASYSCS